MSGTPSNATPSLVVFTDLDGTLLDSRTYSADPARSTLANLAGRGIPVIFCSSKTAAEQRSLRYELGLDHLPYIVENGAAVLIPEKSNLPVEDWPRASGGHHERVRVFGQPFAEVKAGINRASSATGIRVTGYAELTVRRIAELTGLGDTAAARAQQRDYSETLVDFLPRQSWDLFDRALAGEGLRCRHGGRFRTVASADSDKGRAVRLVASLYTDFYRTPIETAGLGDSQNDEGLLLSVDHPYLLPRTDYEWTPMEIPKLRRVARTGPLGWTDAIADLLSRSPTPSGDPGR